MTRLSAALIEYLALRRSLGYKLERASRVLADFVAYLDTTGASHVTVELAVEWAIQTNSPESSWRAQRLSMARGFARYLQAGDPQHQVPPTGLVPRRRGRPNPYLFSQADVAAIMAAARSLRSPWRAAMLEILVGILSVTGLRVGEAVRLDRSDVDLEQGVLHVRNTKSGDSRDVPLHPSTLDAVEGYCTLRDRLFPHSHSLFVSTTGTRLRTSNLSTVFAALVDQAQLRSLPGTQGPRIGGLRHSFAVAALLGFYASEADVEVMLPLLSTYLGHTSPHSTYWYLQAAPELLAAAAARVESEVTERS